jgi:hypothetical protein
MRRKIIGSFSSTEEEGNYSREGTLGYRVVNLNFFVFKCTSETGEAWIENSCLFLVPTGSSIRAEL